VSRFAVAVAAYLNHGVTVNEIKDHVRECICRPLATDEAKEMIARRGSAARVLASM
jgi:hypothetical protein